MKIKVFVYILCVLCSSGIGYSQMLISEGTSKPGSMIQIGSLKIPWSKANSHYGYLYGIEGLTFANVSSGPSRWINRESYNSYQGVKKIEDVNQNSNLIFSSSSILVFSNASDPSIPDHRGILLFRYKGLLGAINFIRIDGNGLYYQYWAMQRREAYQSPSPLHGFRGKPIFNDNAVHEYNLHHQFETIEITGGSHLIFNSGLTITQSLKITDGILVIHGKEPLYVKNIEIGEHGTLILQENSTVFVSGDWINNGTFFPQTESVVFNGEIPQKISGVSQFYSLEIDTDSIVEASTISAHVLSIQGVFTPGEDSIFTHVFIGDRGVFCPAWQASISIMGDMVNDGKFYHNNGTIILNGSDRQDIDMRDASFFNLVIPGQNVFFRNPPLIESQILMETDGIMEPVVQLMSTDHIRRINAIHMYLLDPDREKYISP